MVLETMRTEHVSIQGEKSRGHRTKLEYKLVMNQEEKCQLWRKENQQERAEEQE